MRRAALTCERVALLALSAAALGAAQLTQLNSFSGDDLNFAELGFDVSIDGGYAVAGDPLGGTFGQLGIFKFDEVAEVWQLTQTVDGSLDLLGLGSSVLIKDATVVAGAPISIPTLARGAVQLYEKNAGSGLFEAGPRIDVPAELDISGFGEAVDISPSGGGDALLAVGARGAFFVYECSMDPQGETLVFSATGTDPSFGRAVAITESFAVVGAPNEDKVFVYARSPGGGSWGFAFELLPPDGEADTNFGSSLSLFNGTLLVGAPTSNRSGENSGAAYFFQWNGDTSLFDFVQKVVGLDSSPDDNFGTAVCTTNSEALIGAPSKDFADFGAPNVGAAYHFIFDEDAQLWFETALVLPPSLDAGSEFGRALHVMEGEIVIGAPGNNTVHFFEAPFQNGQTNEDLCVNGKKTEDGAVCCAGTCEACGGCDCANFDGGASNCCPSTILRSEMECESPLQVACVLDFNAAMMRPNGNCDI